MRRVVKVVATLAGILLQPSLASAQATIAGVRLAYVAKQPPRYFYRELDPR